jgi:hypothetical protein
VTWCVVAARGVEDASEFQAKVDGIKCIILSRAPSGSVAMLCLRREGDNASRKGWRVVPGIPDLGETTHIRTHRPHGGHACPCTLPTKRRQQTKAAGEGMP